MFGQALLHSKWKETRIQGQFQPYYNLNLVNGFMSTWREFGMIRYENSFEIYKEILLKCEMVISTKEYLNQNDF